MHSTVRISSYDACEKFGEYERSVRIAQDAAKNNSSFFQVLSKLPKCVIIKLDIRTAKIMNQLFCNILPEWRCTYDENPKNLNWLYGSQFNLLTSSACSTRL